MASRAEIEQRVRQIAQEEGFPDPELLIATIARESSFNAAAVGDGGASVGLFQEHEAGRGSGLSSAQRQDIDGSIRRAIAEFKAIRAKNPNVDRGTWAALAQRPADSDAYAKGINSSLGQGGSKDLQIVGSVGNGEPEWFKLAKSQVGKPYIWGSGSGAGGRGTGDVDPKTGQPKGYDCSGFASWVYKNAFGVDIPAFTGNAYPQSQAIGQNEAKPGDLVFYNMNQGDPRKQHVAIYAGSGRVIQSGGAGNGVNIADVNQIAGAEFRRVPAAAQKIAAQGAPGDFIIRTSGTTGVGKDELWLQGAVINPETDIPTFELPPTQKWVPLSDYLHGIREKYGLGTETDMARQWGQPTQAPDGVWHFPYTEDGKTGEELMSAEEYQAFQAQQGPPKLQSGFAATGQPGSGFTSTAPQRAGGSDAATLQTIFNAAFDISKQNIADLGNQGYSPQIVWNPKGGINGGGAFVPTGRTVETLASINQRFSNNRNQIYSLAQIAAESGRVPRLQTDERGFLQQITDTYGNPLYDETVASRTQRTTAAVATGFVPTELTRSQVPAPQTAGTQAAPAPAGTPPPAPPEMPVAPTPAAAAPAAPEPGPELDRGGNPKPGEGWVMGASGYWQLGTPELPRPGEMTQDQTREMGNSETAQRIGREGRQKIVAPGMEALDLGDPAVALAAGLQAPRPGWARTVYADGTIEEWQIPGAAGSEPVGDTLGEQAPPPAERAPQDVPLHEQWLQSQQGQG